MFTPASPLCRCPPPLQVLELQEPVADQQGFVYEKAAVVAMLRSASSASSTSGLRIVAGATHRVREADLRPAARVLREQRRLRKQRERGGGGIAAQQEQAEDVIDVV